MTLRLKTDPEKATVETLERHLVRSLALHRELKRLLALEYKAGTAFDTRGLTKLALRKTNSINRLEYLVGAIRDQMKEMATGPLPPTCPRTLANRLRAIPDLTPDQEAALLPLARDLEEENRQMIAATRKNMAMFKGAMDRIWAVSRYAQRMS